MDVSLIGASGAVGSDVLRELLDRGHAVTALVRRPGAVPDAAVTEVLADAHDRAAVEAAVVGADAVVSAFNPGWNAPDLYTAFMTGSRTIQAATRAAGVPRLVVVGGAGSLLAPDGRQLIESMHVPEPYASGVRAARDYFEDLRTETDLDWVFVSPPPGYGPMGPTARRGVYRTGLDHPVYDVSGESTISGPDLALAVVDELERPRHHRQRFTVGY